MKALNDLNLFVETARQGSFSKAANSVSLTTAAVSAAIRRLEEQVQFPLFVRSTRHMRLTQEGEIFLAKTQTALATLQEGLDQIACARGQLAGKLHLSAPSDLGRNLLLDWIDEFIALHPNVIVKLDLSDRLADMYAHPMDIAIRYGHPADSNLVAMPLCESNERVLCASPEYLATHPPILHPDDLQHHNCLCYMLADTLHNKWVLSREGETQSVVVQGNPACNDGDVVHRLAVKGKGIANKSLMDISQDIIDGRLVRILPQWESGPVPIYIVCADRRLITPTIRAFQEFIRGKGCQQRQAVLTAIKQREG
ncbi:LysR family transcriptional regulator [Vibrio anguillarum]|uniref:LysR family transcriptional regulator n=1 Tax=Vibrio anguillarum TaxID=55601 RepID=UPI00097E37C7|nr:LysR family transcriptional regulator [Vibrio anguillarum]AQP34799.1 LysR family transcriptional regulator [Vibrio anguillarum]MBF4284513.1 LysR family transcriptional regulator [Vibrio anguillarum]MBF4287294.1 LysR family transcriptional regulator [Vibrio anguillarum]MBF4341968.1 LysR family transcriptional regulator [Vibrio anguillarum]MBF4356401.1 LysR family transcriptional regulator [Vibrio anguillarum]